MKAMILAAGRGERMRPLTDSIPKPLLSVGPKSLIEYRLESLGNAGITDCIINLSYRAGQIRDCLGDGRRWNLNIHYSYEGEQPLESAGGIIQALAMLGNDPFIAMNADIWTDFDLKQLPFQPDGLAHLVMVDNPQHNPAGDFSLQKNKIHNSGPNMLTYSGIGVYRPPLFSAYTPGKRKLKPVLAKAIEQGRVSGQHFHGRWFDVGTPERLANLRDSLP